MNINRRDAMRSGLAVLATALIPVSFRAVPSLACKWNLVGYSRGPWKPVSEYVDERRHILKLVAALDDINWRAMCSFAARTNATAFAGIPPRHGLAEFSGLRDGHSWSIEAVIREASAPRCIRILETTTGLVTTFDEPPAVEFSDLLPPVPIHLVAAHATRPPALDTQRLGKLGASAASAGPMKGRAGNRTVLAGFFDRRVPRPAPPNS